MDKQRKCPRCDKPSFGTNNYCQEHKNEYMREWRRTHPLTGDARKRANARNYLKTHVQLGKVDRLPCQWPECAETKTEGHHEDYDLPLHVIWLCKAHHRRIHIQGNPGIQRAISWNPTWRAKAEAKGCYGFDDTEEGFKWIRAQRRS